MKSFIKSISLSFFKGFFFLFGLFIAITIFFVFISQKNKSLIPPKAEILPDLNGEKSFSNKAPVILQINIEGIIGRKNLTSKKIRKILIHAKNKLFKDRIKGILLYIKTPGGGVNDSDGIYRELLTFKKKNNIPIYSYVDGLCASGGCYITAASDKIYSNPVSLIGSIGVIIGPFFNVTETLQKIGIESLTLTDGKNKDSMNPFRKWKENESENYKELGNFFYNKFVDTISLSRKKLTKEKLINIYGAKIFDAKKAESLGYIDDGNSSYEKTLLALLKESKINEKKDYQIIKLQDEKKWLENLLYDNKLLKGKIKHQFFKKKLKEPFLYLYNP